MSSREMMWVGLAIVAIIGVALAGFVFWRNHRRNHRHELARRFGPEYERVLNETGSATLAERELEARAKRVRKLAIKDLSEAERHSFSEAWRQTQERFVDTPLIAVRSAHDLVQQVMRARGYPVDDFEQRIADLSVDHASVVEHYRAAHALNERQANTEELRQAMMHYRALFGDLLGAPERAPDSHRMHPAHA
jgi:hypothetical protein